jgi:hypothetical protein
MQPLPTYTIVAVTAEAESLQVLLHELDELCPVLPGSYTATIGCSDKMRCLANKLYNIISNPATVHEPGSFFAGSYILVPDQCATLLGPHRRGMQQLQQLQRRTLMELG